MDINFEGLCKNFHEQLTAEHYIGIDLETTGLSPLKFAQIIEFAAFRVDNDDPQKWDKLYSLIKPKSSIPKKITKLTGITNEQVKNAPGFTHFAKELYTFMSDAYIIAHNASFEKRFLDYYMNYNQLLYTNEYVDTLKLYKVAFPDRGNYTLESFLAEFGLTNDKWHTAESDAYYTTLAFMKLRSLYLKHYGIDDPISYEFEDRLFESSAWVVKSANYWSKALHTKNPRERLYVRVVNPEGEGVANIYYDYIVSDWDYNNSITHTPLDFSDITNQILKMKRVKSLSDLKKPPQVF